jgi:hypothetical protein
MQPIPLHNTGREPRRCPSRSADTSYVPSSAAIIRALRSFATSSYAEG